MVLAVDNWFRSFNEKMKQYRRSERHRILPAPRWTKFNRHVLQQWTSSITIQSVKFLQNIVIASTVAMNKAGLQDQHTAQMPFPLWIYNKSRGYLLLSDHKRFLLIEQMVRAGPVLYHAEQRGSDQMQIQLPSTLHCHFYLGFFISLPHPLQREGG